MSQSFPPRPDHPRQVELLLEVFASVVEGRTAWYVSSPLTTGPRAFEWHRQNKRRNALDGRIVASDEFRRGVIEPNRTEAAAFVHKLRETRRRIVIDPTALEDLPEWSQADYRVFWGRVIEEFAEAVVFRDGWMYSSGCAYEFFVALSSRVHVLAESLSPLTLEQGRALIAEAAEQSRRGGVTSQFLEEIHQALISFAPPDLGEVAR